MFRFTTTGSLFDCCVILQAVLASREGYNVATFVYQREEAECFSELICEGFSDPLTDVVSQVYENLTKQFNTGNNCK